MTDHVRDTCIDCGVADINADDVRLVVFDKLPKQNYYAFDCPDCGTHNRKFAAPNVVAKLETAVKKHTVKIPAEYLETMQMTGDPITEVDVDAFIAQLYG